MKSPSTLPTSTQPGSPVLTFGLIRCFLSEGSLALTDLTLCETNRPHSYQKGEELTNLMNPNNEQIHGDQPENTFLQFLSIHTRYSPQIRDREYFSSHPHSIFPPNFDRSF